MRRCCSDGAQGCQGAPLRLNVLAPDGVDWALAVANRNFLIHQYDEINRELTWLTLSRDLPEWKQSLAALFDEAEAAVAEESEGD